MKDIIGLLLFIVPYVTGSALYIFFGSFGSNAIFIRGIIFMVVAGIYLYKLLPYYDKLVKEEVSKK